MWNHWNQIMQQEVETQNEAETTSEVAAVTCEMCGPIRRKAKKKEKKKRKGQWWQGSLHTIGITVGFNLWLSSVWTLIFNTQTMTSSNKVEKKKSPSSTLKKKIFGLSFGSWDKRVSLTGFYLWRLNTPSEMKTREEAASQPSPTCLVSVLTVH